MFYFSRFMTTGLGNHCHTLTPHSKDKCWSEVSVLNFLITVWYIYVLFVNNSLKTVSSSYFLSLSGLNFPFSNQMIGKRKIWRLLKSHKNMSNIEWKNIRTSSLCTIFIGYRNSRPFLRIKYVGEKHGEFRNSVKSRASKL